MKKLLKEIHQLAKEIDHPVNLMEVCGTHTEAIAKHGIRNLMPSNINLTTGPGCPVCVTDQRDIDNMIALAMNNIPIATYGDMLRVPGTTSSLLEARSKGAKVKIIYSVEECLKNPDAVFFGIGFDTTAPMTASIIKKGITTYSAHKTFPPALQALNNIPNLKVDGYINPGHVSTITGLAPYQKIKKPQVIAGFEPTDILLSIKMLLQQIRDNNPKAENQYSRLVQPEGNTAAQKLLDEVFCKKDTPWRGFGIIPKSGLEIKRKYAKYNAKIKFQDILKNVESKPITGCLCATIVTGIKHPKNCPSFKKKCTPLNPIGPCMVSREGACNIEYNHG